MYYATTDHDGWGLIDRDAMILKFRTLAEVVDYVRPDGGEGSIQHGRFADCWIKSLEAPRVGTHWIAPFRLHQVSVLRPGEHPGGDVYWVSPRENVIVWMEAA